MGTYFSLRTEKKSPLFEAVELTPNSPKDSLRSGKVGARAFAASFAGAQREAAARTLTHAIVESYWKKIQEGAINPFPLREVFLAQKMVALPNPICCLAHNMGEAAGALEPLAAAYLISATYTAMLPSETRSRLGAYYTPPPLAERLVSMATSAGVNWRICRVLDPACGGGAFLSAAAKPLAEAADGKPPEHFLKDVASRLRGFEIDPFAAWLSQVFVEARLMPWCERAGQQLPILVDVCDSFSAPEPKHREGHYDLVIGNPPYGRVSLPASMRARYSRSLYGHANLYGLFTDLAVRFTCPGGVIAYVTPTSFLAGQYFKSLRRLLLASAYPVNIDFISVRKGVFDDALQETMLATYRKTDVHLNAPTVHFVAPTEDDKLRVEHGGSFDLPAGGDPWLVPRNQQQARLACKLRSMPHRLRDYGYAVSTGPLVWNRHKPQLLRKSGKCIFPLIWAEAVASDGRFQFRADKKNHLPYFRVRDGDGWLITRKPCVLLQRTTAKEQTRRLIAAELPGAFIRRHGAVVIENHLNMVYPITGSPRVSARVLAAMLNSAPVDCAFRCISGSVAVSAYELENLPLPPPDDLKRLLAGSTSRSSVDKACSLLYAGGANG